MGFKGVKKVKHGGIRLFCRAFTPVSMSDTGEILWSEEILLIQFLPRK
jgi:hypothetical protein